MTNDPTQAEAIHAPLWAQELAEYLEGHVRLTTVEAQLRLITDGEAPLYQSAGRQTLAWPSELRLPSDERRERRVKEDAPPHPALFSTEAWDQFQHWTANGSHKGRQASPDELKWRQVRRHWRHLRRLINIRNDARQSLQLISTQAAHQARTAALRQAWHAQPRPDPQSAEIWLRPEPWSPITALLPSVSADELPELQIDLLLMLSAPLDLRLSLSGTTSAPGVSASLNWVPTSAPVHAQRRVRLSETVLQPARQGEIGAQISRWTELPEHWRQAVLTLSQGKSSRLKALEERPALDDEWLVEVAAKKARWRVSLGALRRACWIMCGLRGEPLLRDLAQAQPWVQAWSDLRSADARFDQPGSRPLPEWTAPGQRRRGRHLRPAARALLDAGLRRGLGSPALSPRQTLAEVLSQLNSGLCAVMGQIRRNRQLEALGISRDRVSFDPAVADWVQPGTHWLECLSSAQTAAQGADWNPAVSTAEALNWLRELPRALLLTRLDHWAALALDQSWTGDDGPYAPSTPLQFNWPTQPKKATQIGARWIASPALQRALESSQVLQ